jgi:hypothetical protein
VALAERYVLAGVMVNEKTSVGLYVFKCRDCRHFQFGTPCLDIAAIVMEIHDNLKHRLAKTATEVA